MFFLRVFAVATVLITFVGCGKKGDSPVKVEEVAVRSFAPNQSGQITEKQYSLWGVVNKPINELVVTYVDLLNTDDDVEKEQYTREYNAKVDSICIESGLTGGRKEYDWITKQVGNAINAPVVSGKY